MIISFLELLPTHIVTSPSTSLCLFCNSRFELLLLATEPVSNTVGFAINTSKVHINNMYIQYTFVHFVILLIRQILGAVPLPVTSPFAVEALSLRLRSRLGLLHLSSNLLSVLLEVPFLSLTILLETCGLVNHQHLMLFLISTFADFSIAKSLGNRFHHPLHIIVHHEVLVTW